MRGRWRAPAGALLLAAATLTAACGSSSASTQPDDSLLVSPQNSEWLVGSQRVGLALVTRDQQTPVLGAQATFDIQRRGGQPFEHGSLSFVGGQFYNSIPVYLGVGSFPATGEFEILVSARTTDGATRTGHAFVNVTDQSHVLPVGHPLSEVKGSLAQPVAATVGGDLSRIDSAVKGGKPDPDPFHDATIADGLAAHRPMLLYFGEPGRCVSLTCGPTVSVLESVYPEYRGRVLFEHIEVHYPAYGEAFSPTYVAFGLQSEPWVFLVNAKGVVADRFEGPLSADLLRQAIEGTLAGHVPAVDVQTSH